MAGAVSPISFRVQFGSNRPALALCDPPEKNGPKPYQETQIQASITAGRAGKELTPCRSI